MKLKRAIRNRTITVLLFDKKACLILPLCSVVPFHFDSKCLISCDLVLLGRSQFLLQFIYLVVCLFIYLFIYLFFYLLSNFISQINLSLKFDTDFFINIHYYWLSLLLLFKISFCVTIFLTSLLNYVPFVPTFLTCLCAYVPTWFRP